MRTLLITIFTFACLISQGQIVGNNKTAVDLDTLNIQYIQVHGNNTGLLKKKIVVSVDYGQLDKSFDQDAVIKDHKGTMVVFYSMVDALNFFYNNGWEFVSEFVSGTPSTGYYYIYTLQRRK